MIVAKFGGSSLADAGQIRKALAIARENPERRVVVVSAPGKRHPDDVKITDEFALWHRRVANAHSLDGVDVRIGERFKEIVHELDVDLNVDVEMARIQKFLSRGASLDFAMSRGEYLNAKIIAKALAYSFLDATECIRFDADGPYRQDDALLRDKVDGRQVVIPGFYGSTSVGSIKTFSRGGSDLTGAIVARALGADLYENWTDVSGLKMVDPRIVPDARTIHWVTHREMRELSYMGASVFHEEAMFPVQEAGITTHIRNTNAPHERGTRIVADAGDPTEIVTAIAGRKGFAAITIEQMLMDKQVGFARRILSILEEEGVSFEHMPGGVDYLTVTIDTRNLSPDTLGQVFAKLKEAFPGASITSGFIAHVVVVGRGMVNHPGCLEQASAALRKAGVNVLTVNQGIPQTSITFGVSEPSCYAAIEALYRAFVP